MNEDSTISQWLAVAESDFKTAELLTASNHEGDYSRQICYHSQQCIEKLLKAATLAQGQIPPKLHDLSKLVQLLETSGLEWQYDFDDLEFLSTCAVEFRYPGRWAERQDAEEAFALCQTYRERLLRLLTS